VALDVLVYLGIDAYFQKFADEIPDAFLVS
jgi:hypothetical protein